jgi:hypothetical protein
MKNNSGNWLVMVYFVIVFAVAAMFASCTSTSKTGSAYNQHLRSTHHNNFINKDNGGCGWANN